MIALSTEQGFTQWLAMGTLFRGQALPSRERGTWRRCTRAWPPGGPQGQNSYGRTISLCWPKLYRTRGQIAQGLTVLAEALAVVENTRERFYEAELYRLKGELLLQSGVQSLESKVFTPHSEAVACFHQALDVARRQQAKSLELRAAMSLARLWQQQGKQGEAQQLLAPIYGWFTEGFDTPDLQEAKALLEELA